MTGPEHQRMNDPLWYRWGPYLAERAWGTVREDYSPDGDAWTYFTHDDARRRPYRWTEDGLGGFSDDRQHVCWALALWNGKDPILKERLFGLTNPEGNHGEDVKEVYFYTDATPTASYAAMRYAYPVAEFPYRLLVEENGRRGRHEPEFELSDTGVFDGGFFDVEVVYAKASPETIVQQVSVINRSDQMAPIWVMPTIWFRNTWAWGYPDGPDGNTPGKPAMTPTTDGLGLDVHGRHYRWSVENADEIVMWDNDFGRKEALHRAIVDGDRSLLKTRSGSRAAAIRRVELEPRATTVIRTVLADGPLPDDPAAVVAARRAEADTFAERAGLSPEVAELCRQARAGLVWTKQFYHYDVEQWLTGDPAFSPPPPGRGDIRNGDWDHLHAHDVLSMPDAWEYPWFATWDSAFQSVAFAAFDAGFARHDLETLTSARYLHPNGQLPAYEWDFGNVNPPVLAWAARKVYQASSRGGASRAWLANLFYLLSINYTWWQNREDADGNNVFQGGFLGLDNISLFDRSATLPAGGHIDQSDGTAWMAFFSLGMLRIALTLAAEESRFEPLAMRYFRHFTEISAALMEADHCLWDPDDGFFYDVLHLPDGSVHQLRVRSLVGLLPLIGVEVVDETLIRSLPEFSELLDSFEARERRRGALCTTTRNGRRLLTVLRENDLRRVLAAVFDPDEFLSPFGIRSLSKRHTEPYVLEVGGTRFDIRYEPGESTTGLFGGNSNWRGPIWFPLNYLIIEALREYHQFYGETFTVEYPSGSGDHRTLAAIADDLSRRLLSLFAPDGARKALLGDHAPPDALHFFHEYFDAETGRGLGASHQTGWTALVANLVESTSAEPAGS